jgi:multidrug efflux pump subunit AcrA (membrane-fusion protein)
VSVATATQESMPIEIHAVSTVEPSAVIQVKSQIGGTLIRVAFAEGSNVKEGDLLFEIDNYLEGAGGSQFKDDDATNIDSQTFNHGLERACIP